MGRPNRNNRDTAEVLNTDLSLSSVYNTAIYARLSVEDNGCESDSIGNQIELLKKYVANNQQLVLVSTFYDNGATGTNFERAGFIAMLDEVKKGKINCIVVKDLSRFGRNYMETGNYLEKIFPCLGVRFISVNDNYDSISVTANEELALSLKNVYHHIYAKDISRKICTVFESKKKQGLFLGRFAPYGYKKSDSNKYKLEIEEETAGVVQSIFRMRLEGMGVTSIARALNDKGIASYYKMLFDRGLLKGTRGEAMALWSGSSVKGILENPIYLGCIVERKGDYAYYKGIQKREIPPSEWNYIENTHDALIDRETFEKVQTLIKGSKQAAAVQREQTSHRERTENILRGLLVCSYCKKNMVRDSGYYDADGKLIRHRYNCSNKYRRKESCKANSLVEAELLSNLRHMVTAEFELLADTNDLLNDYLKSGDYDAQKSGIFSQGRGLEAKLLQMKNKVKELYQDYKQGLLSESAYIFAQDKYENQQRELELHLKELNERAAAAKKNVEPDMDWRSKALSRDMCLALVERIEVYNDHIAVKYTFQSEYEQVISFLSEYADVRTVS